MNALLNIFDKTSTEFPEAATCEPSVARRPDVVEDHLCIGLFLKDASGNPIGAVALEPRAALAVARWIIDQAFELERVRVENEAKRSVLENDVPRIVDEVVKGSLSVLLERFDVLLKDDADRPH